MKKFNMKEIFKISYKQSDYLKTLDNEDKKKFKKLPEDDKNRIVYEWLVETGQWDKEKVNDNQNRNAEIKTNINNNSITEPKKSGLYTFISIVIVISSLLTFAEPTFALLTLILVIMLLVKFIGVSKKDVEYIPDLYDVKHSIYNRQEENKVLQTDNETLEEKIHSNKNILIKIEKDIENKKHILNEITEQIKPKLEDYNFNLLYPINMFDDMSSYDIKNEINDLNMQEKRTSNVNEIINNTDIDNKKHAKNQLKQIITLFNVECEFLFNKLTSNNFDTNYNRIIKNFEQLNKLFETDGVHLEDSFLQIKLKKLELFHRLQNKTSRRG